MPAAPTGVLAPGAAVGIPGGKLMSLLLLFVVVVVPLMRGRGWSDLGVEAPDLEAAATAAGACLTVLLLFLLDFASFNRVDGG